MPIPAAIIPALISAAGAVAGAGIKFGTDRANITRQNRYNSPMEQLRRLRQAGLPYGAYAAGQAGNQSTVQPGTDAGLTQSGQNIGQYYSTKKQIEEINKIKEDIENQKLVNAKLAGELEWYRAGAGTDPSRTNLSSMMAMDQQIKASQKLAQEAAAQVGVAQAGNIRTKIYLENTEQGQRIKNMITQNIGEGVKIEGYKIDNALKQIEKQWKPSMNKATLEGILHRNDIMVNEKVLQNIEIYLRNHTTENAIQMSDLSRMTAELGYKMFGVNYQQNKEYQRLVDMARDLWDGEGKKMTTGEFVRALGAQLYTIISGTTGSSRMPNMPSINMPTYNEWNPTKNFYKSPD